jgi:DNA-binding NarL/FixJ family response regulator
MLSERICPLTQRQIEVLAAVAREGSYKAAGAALGVGLDAIKYHTTNIIRRLGVGSVTTAAVYAVERRWIKDVTIGRETRFMTYTERMEGIG